jgi:putative FmdB family regulatory protein
MPVYEYTCKSCDVKFDHLARSMSSADGAAKVKCPKCGSVKTARALSVFAVGAEAGGKSSAAASDAPTCGRCGGAPGSCGMG